MALDAACGTGRFAAVLAERGHRVLGVDSSPDMLARARERVPRGEFHLGDLTRLPVPDGSVDLVVCSLALTHVPSLDPVLAEFARVLRPGGHVVTSDIHPEGVARGSVPPVLLPDGRPGRVASYSHPIGDYVRAALAAGLLVRRCDEPRIPAPGPDQRHDPSAGSPDDPAAGSLDQPAAGSPDDPPCPPGTLGPWQLWPWCLSDLAPEAARAAISGAPAIVVWHFQLGGHPA